jgi:tartrate dehydratase beta subunit/fumarate hydratase class I family protein
VPVGSVSTEAKESTPNPSGPIRDRDDTDTVMYGDPATMPEKVTVPSIGATTSAPIDAEKSMVRCPEQ